MRDLKQLVQRVQAHPGWSPGMSALVELDDAVGVALSSTEFVELAYFLNNVAKLRVPARVAIVVSTDFMYGLGRMWEAYSSNTSATSRVFRSSEAAIAWLQAEERAFSDVVPGPNNPGDKSGGGRQAG